MPTLTSRDGIYILNLGDDENRFSLNWLEATERALGAVEDEPAPLITTGSGKFYSNGLDLDWVTANLDQVDAYTDRVHALFARILTLPVPTAAAINGHAFAAGAMLAVAHDWRIMRSDRGYLCFPEIDIPLPFTPGMAALIQAKLTPRSALDAMTTGTRYGGPAALTAGLVDETAERTELLDRAVARLSPLVGKDHSTLGAIKRTMYADILPRLTRPSDEPAPRPDTGRHADGSVT